MPDRVIDSDANHEEEAKAREEQPFSVNNPPVSSDEIREQEEDLPASSSTHSSDEETKSASKTIWTPAFMLIFMLTLILGISAESLLAVSWQSHLFIGNAGILFVHIGLVTLGWLVLGLISRKLWVRIGCIFGGFWSAFMLFTVFMNAQGLDPASPIGAYTNVAASMALLGTYLGLSLSHPRTRWDNWLLFLLPLLGVAGVGLTWLLTPHASILTLENAIAVAAMLSCWFIWWLRPSCWKRQPGPTFLFGIVPAILLAMAIVNASSQNLFLLQITSIYTYITVANTNNLFFAQLILLSLFLGCLRFTKSELAN